MVLILKCDALSERKGQSNHLFYTVELEMQRESSQLMCTKRQQFVSKHIL